MYWRLSIKPAVAILVLLLSANMSFAQEETEDTKAKKGIGDSISSGVNVLNKVGGGLLKKAGGVASKVANIKTAKPPGSIAVLPAIGQGTEEEQNEIRIALHNSLGATNIRSLKPAEVDRLLVVAEQTNNTDWQSIDKKTLTALMGVDGLLYVDVEKIDRLYAAAYAHYEVGVKVELYTAAADEIIWETAEKEAERKGGVSINPLGMIATAVSSARILSDAVRQVLVNTLARRVANDIPQPSTFLNTKKPVIIDMAVSNGIEGPFSVGDQITVLAKAEPGLVMLFDINGLAEKISLDEKAEGEYIGHYVVAAGDDSQNLFITLSATRVSDKANLLWRVPGKLAVDTVPPGNVEAFIARSTSEGIALQWQAPVGEDSAGVNFRLEKANVNDGIYQELGNIAITEFLDTNVDVGANYYYRIRSIDQAGNEGTSLSRKVSVFKPGPTVLSGLLEGDIVFPAIGNPYRLSTDLTIASGANITFDTGTIIELTPGQTITAQGRLNFAGLVNGQATVRGDGWKIVYDGAGASNSTLTHMRLSGINANMNFIGSDITINEVSIDGVTLAISQQTELALSQARVFNADPGIRLVAGKLSLNDVVFSNNEQAIVNADASGQSSLNMNNVKFDRNKVVLSSPGAYTLSHVEFNDANLTDIQAMLDGPISLNWSTVKGGKELVRAWLTPNMLSLKQALRRQDWQESSELLGNIEQILPSDGISKLKTGLSQMNKGFSQVAYGAGSSGLGKLLSEGNRVLWVQSETLPSAQAKSEELSLRTMLKKFGKSYVKEAFPNKSSAALSKAVRGLKLQSAVDDSQYLYRVDKGLLSEVWVVHVVNQSVLNGLLASAGLGSSAGSRQVYAVNIDNSAASNIILDVLEAQKIRYKVSKSSNVSPYRLSANVVVSDTESQISKNLKVAEATIRLRLEDTQTNRVLGSWKAAGSASAFGKSDANKQALEKAIQKIESVLVRKLWEVDSKPLAKPKPKPKPQVKKVEPVKAIAPEPTVVLTKPTETQIPEKETITEKVTLEAFVERASEDTVVSAASDKPVSTDSIEGLSDQENAEGILSTVDVQNNDTTDTSLVEDLSASQQEGAQTTLEASSSELVPSEKQEIEALVEPVIEVPVAPQAETQALPEVETVEEDKKAGLI